MEWLVVNRCSLVVNLAKPLITNVRESFRSAIWVVLAISISFPGKISAQSVAKPFPNHTIYTVGSIKPTRSSQNEMDSDVVRFYKAWKQHYIVRAPVKKECYVYCNADGNWHGGNKSPNSISLSEGHGYGMIIMAIMAGYDTEAKEIFDGMLDYFKDHPSSIDHHLMAWNQTRDTARTEHNSDDATDGDLDIAFALLLADKQWGSTGTYNYKKQAIEIIDGLKQSNINPETKLPMMGDFTEKGEPFYYDTRPSDFMPDHFKMFALAAGDSAWNDVSDNCYAVLTYLQRHFSPVAGLFPDFAIHSNNHPRPAYPFLMENRKDGDYSYNACRIPFRLGCDYLINGDRRAKTLLTPINHWITKQAKNDPYKIKDGYTLTGKAIIGSSGDNIAFICPFGIAAMTDSKNYVWLNRIWDYAVNEPLSDEEYYGNTIKLLSIIVMSGNWWE
jgi:endoglucanase